MGTQEGESNNCDTSSLTRSSDFKFRCLCNEESSKDGDEIIFYDKILWNEIQLNGRLKILDQSSITYEEFFGKYLQNNVPCMLGKDVTESWFSRQNWVAASGESACGLVNLEEQSEAINFDFLLDIYGHASVSVIDCDDDGYKGGYGMGDCRDVQFSEYIPIFREKTECLYLKDWHIVRYHKDNLPGKQLPYKVPIFFQSDWLNEVCDAKDADDFKFCYMGPKGSFTTFHSDVYGSYSWSANIFGVKKWYLYPPGKESRFGDAKNNKLKYTWSDPGIPGEDFIEVVQNAGECLFVPSGWFHVVWNVTDCISINQNWFNGANICYIWKMLQDGLRRVENELQDLRDIPEFHEQCQLVLRANHGMNYEDFFEILKTIQEARNSSRLTSRVHFDLESIRHVVAEHCALDSVAKLHYNEYLANLSAI